MRVDILVELREAGTVGNAVPIVPAPEADAQQVEAIEEGAILALRVFQGFAAVVPRGDGRTGAEHVRQGVIEMPFGARKRQVFRHGLSMNHLARVIAPEAERVPVADTTEFDRLGDFRERVLRQPEVLICQTWFQ